MLSQQLQTTLPYPKPKGIERLTLPLTLATAYYCISTYLTTLYSLYSLY